MYSGSSWEQATKQEVEKKAFPQEKGNKKEGEEEEDNSSHAKDQTDSANLEEGKEQEAKNGEMIKNLSTNFLSFGKLLLTKKLISIVIRELEWII